MTPDGKTEAVVNAAISRVIEARDQVAAQLKESLHSVTTTRDKAVSEIKRASLDVERLRGLSKQITELEKSANVIESRLSVADVSSKKLTALIGKTVQLISGGPSMSASHMDDDGLVVCYWYDNGMHEQAISAKALKVVKE